MQQCGDCLKVYDESENASCPFCSEESDSLDDCDGEDQWTGICPECEGSGRAECNVCKGEGGTDTNVCTACDGDGGMDCPDCDGSGEITVRNGQIVK